MNDVMEQKVSSLAIVEKKPQRPGGCVGIFFQLFDWNRRFAKTKLFSKKLLPAVRPKQASKKFGGDEKQPKHRLISNENSGGFPNAKRSNGAANVDLQEKHEMRPPGLVARLMGLESMPLLHREKSTKVPVSGGTVKKEEKPVEHNGKYTGGKWTSEGGCKHELRPQKLQKTSFRERHLVTGFGAEIAPFKNVLSKSRKHHPKLPSPVKSPRNISRKNASKLIGAATKILEPRMQKSRPKFALTYSNTLHQPHERNIVLNGVTGMVSSKLRNADDFNNAGLEGQPSCRNCGHLLDDLDSKPNVIEQPLIFGSHVSQCVGSSCQGLQTSEPRHPAFCCDLEEELHEEGPGIEAPVMDNLRMYAELKADKSPFNRQVRCHLGSQQPNVQKDVPLSLTSTRITENQNQRLQARDKIHPRSNISTHSSYKLPTSVMNETIPRQNARLHGPARMDNGKFEKEKRIVTRQNESVTPGRKRRPTNISKQGESFFSPGSTMEKQSHSFSCKMRAKEFNYNVHPVKQQCYEDGLAHLQQRRAGFGQVDTGVASFRVNSPAKQRTGLHAVERNRTKNDASYNGTSEKSITTGKERRIKFDKPVPLSGDALGALLEQKLKELTCQGEDIEENVPKKTTATILQELISALTSEIPFQQDNSYSHSHLSSSPSSTISQVNAMAIKFSADQALDSEQPSPGSVLEAYFSNESCLSSSTDDSSRYKILEVSVDGSHYESKSLKPDLKLWDSTASITTTKCSKELVIDIFNNVCEIICCLNLENHGLTGSKLDHAKEVLLNSALAFQDAANTGSHAQRGLPIKHVLLDELEQISSILWMTFGCSVGVEDGKEVNQLRNFAADSIIEYLEHRIERYPFSLSKVAEKFPLYANSATLICELVEKVRKWDEISKFSLDELIEREMSCSLRKWTQFEIESFETVMEISRQVFEILVDEVVVELWKS